MSEGFQCVSLLVNVFPIIRRVTERLTPDNFNGLEIKVRKNRRDTTLIALMRRSKPEPFAGLDASIVNTKWYQVDICMNLVLMRNLIWNSIILQKFHFLAVYSKDMHLTGSI